MANPLSLPYSLPPYRRVLLIAASFSVWHSSVRPSVRPEMAFLKSFHSPHSFIRVDRANLFETSPIGAASLRSRRVSSCPSLS